MTKQILLKHVKYDVLNVVNTEKKNIKKKKKENRKNVYIRVYIIFMLKSIVFA